MCFWEILAKPQNVGYVMRGGSIRLAFFSGRVLMCLEPLRIFYDIFGTHRIFYRLIFGWPTNEKSQKIDFFRFFQKLSKIGVNVEFCLKNTLNTPRGQFLPIFHHTSQYKPLEKNRFFWTKIVIFWDFWDFLNFDDAIDYSSGNESSVPPRYFYIPCMLLYDH